MAESYSLGTARGTIEIDASTLSRTIAALDTVGNKMALLGGIAIAAFGYAVKSAADFEQQLSRFGAASNATEAQMESLRKKALQLGQDSAYGATEVVKAFAELAYAGATTEEIVSGLGDAVVYLAAAGEIPLADASTTLINTMRQFNIPANEAVGIADELARAANASTVNIEDLNTSLRYVGPVAAAAGISFQSTAEALAVLGNEGIRGSTAGTSLRGILVGITKPSDQATAKMRELGIITADGANQFFTATGEMKSFKEIAQILQDTTRGLTKEQKLNAFGVIFQRRAMATAAVFAKEGAAGFDKLTASAQYNTTAQEIMKKKLDNLKGSLKILKASVETAAITVGELFTPYLKSAADALRELVNWFIDLPAPVKKVIGFLLVAGGSFLILGGAIAKIGSVGLTAFRAFSDLGKAFGKVATALKLVTVAEGEADAAFAVSPIGWVVLAVLALVAAIYLLWTNWDTIWTWIKEHKAYAAILALLFPFIALFIAIVGALKYLYDNWDTIWPKMKAVAKAVLDWFKDAWHDVETWVGDAVQNVVSFVKRLYNGVTKWISEAVTNVISFFERLPTVIINGLVSAGTAILNFVRAIPGWFLYATAYVLGLIIGFNIRLVQLFFELSQQVISWLVNFIVDFITNTVQWGTDFLATVVSFFTQLPGILFGFFLTSLQFMVDFVSQMITNAINLGVQVLTTVIQFFTQLPGVLSSAFSDALNFVISFAGQIVSAVYNMGANAVTTAWNWFTSLPSTIRDAIGNGFDLLYQKGVDIIQGLIDGINSLKHRVFNIVGDIADGIRDGLKDALSIFSPSQVMMGIGKNVVLGLALGMEKTIPRLDDSVSAMANAVTGLGAAIPQSMSGVGLSSLNNLAPWQQTPTTAGNTMNQHRDVVVNQDVTIQALNPDELATKLAAERDWGLRTARVG